MKALTLPALLLILLPAAGASAGEGAAEEKLKALGADVVRDESKPGKPIVEVTFAGAGEPGDDDLKVLAGIPTLRKLALSRHKVTDAGLRHLSGLKELEAFEIYGGDGFTGAGLKHLKGCKRLTAVEATTCRLTAEGVKGWADLPALRYATIYGNPDITDEAIGYLARIKRLRTLKISGTKVTDKGLAHLAGLRELVNLNLNGTGVTDKGLRSLRRIKTLEEVVAVNTKATEKGAADLRKALPMCRVIVTPLTSGR